MPSDSLAFSVDVATKLAAQEKVPDLVEPELKKLGYTRVPFDLWKNQVHVAVSDKAARRASHNVMQLSTEDAAGALAASKNSQIATVLLSGTRTGAGGNWSSIDNPYTDINTAITSIEDTYEAGNVNCLAAPRAVWTAFWSNNFVKGQLQDMTFPAGKTFPIPGLPGFSGIMDNNITAATMVVCDKSKYALLGQEPVEAEGYRNAAAGYDAWVIRDWMEAKIATNNAGYALTGLLS